MSAKLDDHVAAPQTRVVRRAAAAHPRELHARRLGGVVRNRAEVGAHAVAAALAGGALHLHKVRALLAVRHVVQERRGERRDALHPFIVQRVGVVGRAVVVLVAAGEEAQHGHVPRVEGGAVRGQVGVVLQGEVEARRHVAPLDDPPPQVRRANALHDQPVLAQTPDHVEVQIRHHLVERQRRVGDEPRRSDQAEFLAGPQREDDAAAARLRVREQLRQAQHDGRAGGVVVRAVVYFALLVLVGQRANRAAPDVVVVRAHQHVLLRWWRFPARRTWRRGRQQRHHVAVRLLNALDANARGGRDAQWKAALEVRRLLVEGGLRRRQVFARGGEQVLGDGEIHGQRNDAGIRQTVVEAHRRQRPGVGRVGARRH